jgi:hypothetical protein
VVADMPKLPPPQHITDRDTQESAAQKYADTLRRGRYDDGPAALEGPSTIEGECLDVTPESGEDSAS